MAQMKKYYTEPKPTRVAEGLRELYGSAMLDHEARCRHQIVFIAPLLISTVSEMFVMT